MTKLHPRQMSRQSFFTPENRPFREIKTTLDSSLAYEEHFHTGFSMGLILEGSTRFFLGGKWCTAKQGDIVLIAPGQIHSCNPAKGEPRSYHMLFIDQDWFRAQILPEAEKNGQIAGQIVVRRPVIRDAALFSAARALVQDADKGCPEASDAPARLVVYLRGHRPGQRRVYHTGRRRMVDDQQYPPFSTRRWSWPEPRI